MEGKVIEHLERIIKEGLVVEVDGSHYSHANLKPVYADPRPKDIKGRTLNSLIDYIKINVEGIMFHDCLIHIEDHKTVSLINQYEPPSMERTVWFKSLFQEIDKFTFGKFYNLEEFLILLRSCFEDTEDREKLLSFASKIVNSTTIELGDDGVSQSVNVTKGISGALKDVKTTPAIVTLKPFRTFLEIEQPKSEFLFRVHSNNEGSVTCALFEADGGLWKLFAIEAIKEYLLASGMGGTVGAIIA